MPDINIIIISVEALTKDEPCPWCFPIHLDYFVYGAVAQQLKNKLFIKVTN